MTVTIVETRAEIRAITGGVDTHADVHVAAALDSIGGLLGVREFPATAAGYGRLMSWLGGFGTIALVGIEGTGSYGAGLALQPPRVSQKLVPVFSGQELRRLEQACAGRSFAQRRDTAIIAVVTATGIRLSELAGLRCSDVGLWQREITVRGKGGTDRIVRIGYQAARSLDRYQRARSRHAQAWRSQRGSEPATGSR